MRANPFEPTEIARATGWSSSFGPRAARRAPAPAKRPSASPRCMGSPSRSSATMQGCAEGASFFVVYGQSRHEVDAGSHRRGRGAHRGLVARRDRAASLRPSSAGRSSSSAPAPGATRTRSASTPSSTTRATRGRRGLESYKAFEVLQPRGAGRKRDPRCSRLGACAPTRSSREPGHHSAQLSQGERPIAGRAPRAQGIAARRESPLRRLPAWTTRWRSSSASTPASGRGPSRRDVASYIVERVADRLVERNAEPGDPTPPAPAP